MRFHIKNATKRQGQHFAKLIREFDLPVYRIETFETMENRYGDGVNQVRTTGSGKGDPQYLGFITGEFAAYTRLSNSEEVGFYEFRRRIFDLAGKPYKKTFREWLVGF